MPHVVSQVTCQNFSGEVPADAGVNVVHHTIDDSGFNPSVDYQNHANEVRDLFSFIKTGPGSTFDLYKGKWVTVKVYDMADPKPRPERAVATHTPTTPNSEIAYGPRQVALVLSFYAGRNLPSFRGRIYVGPMTAGNQNSLRPTSINMNEVLDLGHGLFDLGGENVAHVVYSPTHLATHVVTDYWVDDSWDTMRSRLEKPTTRVRLHP